MPRIRLTQFPSIPDVCVMTGTAKGVDPRPVRLEKSIWGLRTISEWSEVRSRIRRHRAEGRRAVRRGVRTSYSSHRTGGTNKTLWVELQLPFTKGGFAAYESAVRKTRIFIGAALLGVIGGGFLAVTGGNEKNSLMMVVGGLLLVVGCVAGVLAFANPEPIKLVDADEKTVTLEIPHPAAAQAITEAARGDDKKAREHYREQFDRGRRRAKTGPEK